MKFAEITSMRSARLPAARRPLPTAAIPGTRGNREGWPPPGTQDQVQDSPRDEPGGGAERVPGPAELAAHGVEDDEPQARPGGGQVQAICSPDADVADAQPVPIHVGQSASTSQIRSARRMALVT
jgi:hypothetical protein